MDKKLVKEETSVKEEASKKEKTSVKEKKLVRSVSDLIQTLQVIKDKSQPNQRLVYRGENKDYGETACSPNIFRNDNVRRNPSYEINIYNDMYAKGIVKKQSYLDTAIDAQHGGFPSRLLDVSYNILVALYFATEIDFEKENKEPEKSNPRIFIYFIEEIYIPGSFHAEDLFEKLIDKTSPLKNLHISTFNHKLIDHMNKNQRIRAQQGAFILFQGDRFQKIPQYMYEMIEIERASAKKIQQELKDYFGITKGRIYPEPNNQIDLVKNNAEYVNANEISILNEFRIAFNSFNRILESIFKELTKFIYDNLEKQEDKDVEFEIVRKVIRIEENLHYFKEEVENSLNENSSLASSLEKDDLDKLREEVEKLFNIFCETNCVELSERLKTTKVRSFKAVDFNLKLK